MKFRKSTYTTAGKLPPRSVIEKAVKAMQVYMGLNREMRARPGDVKRLKARVDRAVAGIVRITENTEDNVWWQLETEAKKRGITTPMPGKDF